MIKYLYFILLIGQNVMQYGFKLETMYIQTN